jgi:hypothetical protein
MVKNIIWLAVLIVLLSSVACTDQLAVEKVPVHTNPDTGIEFVSVDRFSDSAATIMRRADNPELPAPNEAIDYDADFLRHALGPAGEDVSYYAFDVSSLLSAPVYSFVYESDPSTRVDGQSPVFDSIPGDEGYNDFWQMVRVLVPDGYVANSIKSLDEIEASGFELERTGTIINCPIVPYGSTAVLAKRNSVGWYQGKHVQYFSFESLQTSVVNPQSLDVPYAVVRVIFEDNDPAKGMKVDSTTGKTHNVFDTIPGDELYRALWRHDFVDASAFDSVHDWESSKLANEVDVGVDNILVNCPVVIWPGSEVVN